MLDYRCHLPVRWQKSLCASIYTRSFIRQHQTRLLSAPSRPFEATAVFRKSIQFPLCNEWMNRLVGNTSSSINTITNTMILLGRRAWNAACEVWGEGGDGWFSSKLLYKPMLYLLLDEHAPISLRLNKLCAPYRARDRLISDTSKGLVSGRWCTLSQDVDSCRDERATSHELQLPQATWHESVTTIISTDTRAWGKRK